MKTMRFRNRKSRENYRQATANFGLDTQDLRNEVMALRRFDMYVCKN